MNYCFPCVAWSEQLALCPEDLSPTDRAALATHVRQCSACAAVQADYQFLDTQLHALPSPMIKPLPRLLLYNRRE